MSTILVPTPCTIYVLVEDRADFDKIDLPPTDHGPKPCGHVLTKTVEQHGVLVILQHWQEA